MKLSEFENKLELVVIQPTSQCNLNCHYCYLPDRRLNDRMSLEILDVALRKILRSRLTNPHLIILWHAGEPMIAGLPFYERALLLIERYKSSDQIVEHSIQTNATLLTDEWCTFLKGNQFHVGVSLDGPEFLHDQQRVDWNGRGSFNRVIAGIDKLREHKIEFGVLAVLSAASLKHPDEIYDFFKSIGAVSVGFNVEEAEHMHKTSSLAHADHFQDTRDLYYRFFARLIDRVRNDPQPLTIREIERLLKSALRIRNDRCYAYEPLEANPFRMITILRDGSISAFSPEFAGDSAALYDDFNIGNICQEELEDIASNLATSLLNSHTQESRRLCQSKCKYYAMCGGTYFSNKWAENRALLTQETVACRLHSQAVIDAFLDCISVQMGTAQNPVEK